MLRLFNATRVFQEQMHAIAEKFGPHLDAAAPFFEAIAQFDWPALRSRLDELPIRSKEAMSLALSQGWFFGWHDGLQSLMRLVEKLGNSGPGGVDQVMIDYYRLNFGPFAEELINKYPEREAPIRAAVDAHLSHVKGRYFLSVPVFVAQADGLLIEITGLKLPMANAAQVLGEKYAGDPETLGLLHPLLELKGSDFMRSAKAREAASQASGKFFTALNRHQVMHGERSDYGTETNSLKAFSFLVFAGLHVPAVLER